MTNSGLHLVRTFNWGLLLVNDRGTTDLPRDVAAAPDFATATRTALAVNVRHAADVDGDDDAANVNINVVVGPAPSGAMDYRTELDVTTGALEVGDAETVDEPLLGPGTYVVAVRISPADHPDHVELWIEGPAPVS